MANLSVISRRSFFVSRRKMAGIPECSHFEVGTKRALTTINKRNVHNITEMRKRPAMPEGVNVKSRN